MKKSIASVSPRSRLGSVENFLGKLHEIHGESGKTGVKSWWDYEKLHDFMVESWEQNLKQRLGVENVVDTSSKR